MLKKDKLVGAIVYYDGELTAPLLLGFFTPAELFVSSALQCVFSYPNSMLCLLICYSSLLFCVNMKRQLSQSCPFPAVFLSCSKDLQ